MRLEEAFGCSAGVRTSASGRRLRAGAARPEIPIRPDRTYVVTGGLGALGLVTANELVAAGARHIALIGRSGAPAPDVAELVERLRATAEVTVHRGDVAEPADLTRVLAEIGRRPHPIGGIVHSAGMLRDAPVAAQTWESIDEVFRPKVYGTWLLHQAARDLPELAFLIGYSSAAPIVAHAGAAQLLGGQRVPRRPAAAPLRRRAGRVYHQLGTVG
nr:beta-ketoacyl reductase [Salinispora arenicola]